MRLEGVTARYERRTAVDDVSLEINAGERLAILGANGSGKTTLLKLLAGLQPAEAGTLTLFGQVITRSMFENARRMAPIRGRIGVLFQNPDVQLFNATVRDEIAYGPLHLGLGPDEVAQRVADAASMMGAARLLDSPPWQLSTGEKKRVALASVLAMNPDVFLLDEPTAGLDPRAQTEFADLLHTLTGLGRTTVLATHDLSIVPVVADRAVVFGEDHRIAADSTAEAVLSDVDLLVGSNLIHAHPHRHGAVVHSHMHYHDAAHQHSHENLDAKADAAADEAQDASA